MLRRKILALLTAAIAALGVVVVQGPAVADRGHPFTFIELGSSWSYRQVAHGRLPGFENGDDADNSFQEGDAPFGRSDPRCASDSPPPITTLWKRDRDLLLRNTFYIPTADDRASVYSLRISGLIDAAVDLYIDGELVGHVANRGCEVRSSKLTTSAFDTGFNTIAVRAAGDGPTNYFDLQVVGKIFYEQG